MYSQIKDLPVTLLYTNSGEDKVLTAEIAKRALDTYSDTVKLLDLENFLPNHTCTTEHSVTDQLLSRINCSDQALLLLVSIENAELSETIFGVTLPKKLARYSCAIFNLSLALHFPRDSFIDRQNSDALQRKSQVLNNLRINGQIPSPSPAIDAMFAQINNIAEEVCQHEQTHIPIILLGPRGSGKTAVAKVCAQMANIPNVHIVSNQLMQGFSSNDKENYIRRIIASTNREETSLVIIENVEDVIEYVDGFPAKWNRNFASLINKLLFQQESNKSTMVLLTAHSRRVISRIGMNLRYRLNHRAYTYTIDDQVKLKWTLENIEPMKSRNSGLNYGGNAWHKIFDHDLGHNLVH